MCLYNPTFSNLVILHTYPPIKVEQSVLKRRHIKFRRGITQKQAYNPTLLKNGIISGFKGQLNELGRQLTYQRFKAQIPHS